MPELVTTVLITSLISSIVGAAVGAAVSKIKTLKAHNDEGRQNEAEMRETLNQNTLMTCRLVIYSDKFDIDEKIEAYIIYRAKGGNHRTKAYMDEQVGCDIDDYIARHKH